MASAGSFQHSTIHSGEVELAPSMTMNRESCFKLDSDSEIASQIIASFRNSMIEREKRMLSKDLGDEPTYLNLDTQENGPGVRVPIAHEQSWESYREMHDNATESSAKVFGDLSYAKTHGQGLPIMQQTTLTDIPPHQTSGYRPCDDPCQNHNSDFKYQNDSSDLVSSTENTDMEASSDPSSSTFSNTLMKFDKSHPRTSHELPPCRVCSYKASGFHYGVNTCEACKGFFRRSLKKENLEYKCISGDNNCVIQKGRRNNCPLCRYNRCLDVGMSKDAIKTGRYTHQKRTQDIIEVKGLKGDHLSAGSNFKPAHVEIKEEPVLEEEHLALIDKIFNAHKVLFPLWHKALDSGMVPSMCKSYSEKYQLKKKESQISEIYSPEETQEVPEENDRMKTMDILTKHLELAIMVFVKFAKTIPGFCDLSLNDQATLVKSSRFEVWMIGAHKFFMKEYNVVIGPRGNAFHMEELAGVLDEEFVNELFNFSAVLQEIKLTYEEIAMMKCVVMTFSDRMKLEEPEKVEQIQLNLISCLQAQLNSVKRFSQVMNAFVRLRDLTEWNKRISENLVLEWPTIKHNPLLMEVMNI